MILNNQIEIIAQEHVKKTYGVKDGDELEISVEKVLLIYNIGYSVLVKTTRIFISQR